MLTEEEKKKYTECTQIFLKNFKSNELTDKETDNYIRRINTEHPHEEVVKDFFKELSEIFDGILNDSEFTINLHLNNGFDNYKDQKIGKYYRDNIFPRVFIVSTIIESKHKGFNCFFKTLLDWFDACSTGFDRRNADLLIEYFDNMRLQDSINFLSKPYQYYQLDREILEYKVMIEKNGRRFLSPRYIEFKLKLRDKFQIQKESDKYFDYDNAYIDLVTQHIGEYLFIDQMFKSPYFIHTSKEVGSFMGYNVYDYGYREYLYNVKSTIDSKPTDEKDSFKVTSLEYKKMVECFNSSKGGNVEYVLARVFINEEFKIDSVLYLRMKDDMTLEDSEGNTYLLTQKDKESFTFTRNGFIRSKKQVSEN